MIRFPFLPLAAFSAAVGLAAFAQPAAAQTAAKPAAKASQKATDRTAAKINDKTAKGAGKTDPKKAAAAKGSSKPNLVGTYGDWAAYTAHSGKDKTCYALSQPKDRQPAGLNRDPAYLFISTRPAESVRNEVSIIMGFPLKDGGEGKADIGTANFDLIAKGQNAWIKNAAEEGPFLDALRRGQKLSIKAPSAKGNFTTDGYSLAGLRQALDRVQKECP